MLEALAAMSTTGAIVASIIVVLVVLLLWKFVKFAFKLALIVAAAVVIFLVLRWAGVLSF